MSPFHGANNQVHAEQIKLGISKQAPENQGISRPERGMSKSQVLELFGEPSSQTPEKGQPPISTWHYPDFSVYMESDYVIHSVLKHRPKTNEAE